MRRLILPLLATVMAAAPLSATTPREQLDRAANLREERRYAASESLAVLARAALERTAPIDTLALAEAWHAIAEARNRRQLYSDTLTIGAAERSLDLLIAHGEGESAAAASAHETIGEVLNATRRASEALVHMRRALEIRRRMFGREDARTTESLFDIGGVYLAEGEADSALAAFREALELRLRVSIPRDRRVGDLYASIGNVLESLGDIAGAEVALRQGILAHERLLGPSDPALAYSLSRAAGFEYRRGDIAQSLEYTERNFEVLSRAQPVDEMLLAGIRGNLATLSLQTDDPARAARLYEQSVATLERGAGRNSVLTISSRIGLANAYRLMGDTTRALEGYAALRRLFESDSTRADRQRYASVLYNEGDLRSARGDHDRALDLGARCQALLDARSTVERPLLVRSIALQMAIHAYRGHVREMARADADLESALVAVAPRMRALDAFAANMRSVCAEMTGNVDAALAHAVEASRIERETLLDNVWALSDRQALGLAAQSSPIMDALLTVAAHGDPRQARLVWDELVRWRGLVRAETALRRPPPRAGADSGLAARHTNWVRAQQRLASFAARTGWSARGASRDSEETELVAEAQNAERRLLRDQPDVRRAARTGLDSVLTRLAPGQAMVAFGSASKPMAFDRVVALVALGGEGSVRTLVLAPLDSVRIAVKRWKSGAGDPRVARRSEAACRRDGFAVRRLVWDPLAAALTGASEVFIVPEEPLHGLPWGALPDGRDRYLVETGPRIHMLDAERELPEQSTPASGEGLLAIGGVDYEGVGSAHDSPTSEAKSAAMRAAECEALARGVLGPLPGTRDEVRTVAALWAGEPERRRSALVLDAAGATEARFKSEAAGRRVIHLATHGVAIARGCAPEPAGTRGVGGVDPIGAPHRTKRVAKAAATEAASTAQGRELEVLLAFAGANRARQHSEDADDGLLTAAEVATLDLRGTEWVVLSACHAGTGVAWAREGVIGMRRAFHLAGARTVIASEWAVEDEATRDWMSAFYGARAHGATSAAEAMTTASRAVLEARRAAHRSTHPFYWAGFTSSGE